MRIKNCLVIMFIISMLTLPASAGTLKADARTKRIPAGAVFRLEFLQPISTFSAGIGDSFTAVIRQDKSLDSTVVLPAGSIVRGSISKIKTAKYFSRGAMLYLDFDHVVTPTGRQIPLDFAIAKFDKIYYDGGLYKNLGYGEAIQSNYDKSVEITKNAIEYGKRVEDSASGLQYITIPVCAIGGFLGGAGYFIGDSIADIFRKGQDVIIEKCDVVDVKLVSPIDVPVY